MESLKFDQQGRLEIFPSANSSQTDFDFFAGEWKIHNRKLKTRLNNCTEWEEFDATGEMHKTLNGIGNTDNFLTRFNGKPFEGMTVRLFDPKTRLWSIYWADSNTGVLDVPVIGSFDNNIGNFFCKDIFNGKEIIMQFIWDKTDIDHPVWSQAFSADNGKTWEWNWYMYFSRQADKLVEIRSYNLKENSRSAFHKLVSEEAIPMLKRWGVDVIAHGPSLHDSNSYLLMRAYNDLPERQQSQDAFYGSDEWKKGPREAILSLIENYTTVVIEADEKLLNKLKNSVKH